MVKLQIINGVWCVILGSVTVYCHTEFRMAYWKAMNFCMQMAVA